MALACPFVFDMGRLLLLRKSVVIVAAALAVLATNTAPLRATVLPPVERTDPWDDGSTALLTVSNFLLTVTNSIQISGDGSYWLGTLGIVSGVGTLAIASTYEDRSLRVDMPAVLSIAAGTLSILRRATFKDSPTVSLEPLISRNDCGVSLSVRF
jgi:hypothetical protein